MDCSKAQRLVQEFADGRLTDGIARELQHMPHVPPKKGARFHWNSPFLCSCRKSDTSSDGA